MNESHHSSITPVKTEDIKGCATDVTGEDFSDPIINSVTSPIAEHITDSVKDGIPDSSTESSTGEAETGDGKHKSFSCTFNFKCFGDGVNHLSIINHIGITRFTQLQEMNAKAGVLFNKEEAIDHVAYDIALMIADFIAKSNGVMIRQLVDAHDIDATVNILLPLLRSFHTRQLVALKKPLTQEAKNHIYAAVELLVIAIHTYSNPSAGYREVITTTGFTNANLFRPQQAIERILLMEKRARSERLMEIAREYYWERRNKFASKTRHQEDDPKLPAHVKMRVFMNALRERNNAGAFFYGTKTDQDGVVIELNLDFKPMLVFRKEDRATVEYLFKRYTGSSVRDILFLLDSCVGVHIDKMFGRGDGSDVFYPAKGNVLAFFLKHLNQIVEQLNGRYHNYCDGRLKR